MYRTGCKHANSQHTIRIVVSFCTICITTCHPMPISADTATTVTLLFTWLLEKVMSNDIDLDSKHRLIGVQDYVACFWTKVEHSPESDQSKINMRHNSFFECAGDSRIQASSSQCHCCRRPGWGLARCKRKPSRRRCFAMPFCNLEASHETAGVHVCLRALSRLQCLHLSSELHNAPFACQ